MNVFEFVNFLSNQSSKEAQFYPVDRLFLEKYLTRIREYDFMEFLSCNLETHSPIYSIQLMVCLYDFLKEYSFNDILILGQQLRTPKAHYSLNTYMFKYLEIDFMSNVFCDEGIQLSVYLKKKIISYFYNTWGSLIKDEEDKHDLTRDVLGVTYDDLKSVSKKFLTNPASHKAPNTIEGVRDRILGYHNLVTQK